MYETTDLEEIIEAVRLNPDADFDPQDWNGIALSDGEGNLALFVHEFPGVVQGHYFFKSARGKDAVRLSFLALEKVFNEYDIKVVFGLTPHSKKGALWLSKHIGFRSYGKVETPKGPCEKFIMTKEEFNGRNS